MQNNFNKDLLLNMLKSKGLNNDSLKQSVKNNDADGILKSLSESDRKKINDVLNNKEKMNEMLNSKTAKDILNMLKNL